MNTSSAYKEYLKQCEGMDIEPIGKKQYTAIFYSLLNQQKNSFRKASLPLIKYLQENHNPHMTVIVDGTMAEMMSGELVEHYEIKEDEHKEEI